MIRYSALALLLIATGVAQAADKTFDRAFTVSAGGKLTVDADGGEVQVTGNDGNQVVVHMTFRGTEETLALIQADAVQNADGVAVTLRKSKEKKGWFSWKGWNGDGKIEVTVPRNYRVDVHTGGGGVALVNLNGAASLQTSGGDVSARNIIGNLKARTSGGSILVDSVRGDVDADTSGGDVRLLQVDGKIHGNTSGGGVRIALVGANRGISATTSGGDIEVTLPQGTTGAVDLSTSGGGIRTDFQVASSKKTETSLVGSMNGGGEAIYAHTSGGSVSLSKKD